jgi:hypothetical protein
MAAAAFRIRRLPVFTTFVPSIDYRTAALVLVPRDRSTIRNGGDVSHAALYSARRNERRHQ